jgi:hypothetical protein
MDLGRLLFVALGSYSLSCPLGVVLRPHISAASCSGSRCSCLPQALPPSYAAPATVWLLRPLYWPHCVVRKQATPSVVFHILVIVCIEEADMLGQLGEVVKIVRFDDCTVGRRAI